MSELFPHIDRKSLLREHENILHAYEQARLWNGLHLKKIRDEKLYREAGYQTFETYCKERWDLTKREVNKRIEIAELWEMLPDLPSADTHGEAES